MSAQFPALGALLFLVPQTSHLFPKLTRSGSAFVSDYSSLGASPPPRNLPVSLSLVLCQRVDDDPLIK